MPSRSLLPRIDSVPSPDGAKSGFHSLRATARTETPPSPRPPSPHRGRRRLAIGAAVATVLSGAVWGIASHEPRHDIRARIVSGTPAKKTTAGGQVQRWQQAEVTIRVDPRILEMGKSTPLAVERAFDSWSVAGTPSIVVEATSGLTASTVPDGINAVVLAPITVAGHQNDLAVTIGFSDSRTGEIVEADVIINTEYAIEPLGDEATAERAVPGAARSDHLQKPEPGSRAGANTDSYGLEPSCTGNPARTKHCGERYDLESILAHEAGHFFGLGEDETDGRATMFYCTSACETHKRSLERGDMQAMTEVYAPRLDDAPEVRCSAASVGASRSTFIQVASLLAFLGLVAGHRAPRVRMWQRRR